MSKFGNVYASRYPKSENSCNYKIYVSSFSTNNYNNLVVSLNVDTVP